MAIETESSILDSVLASSPEGEMKRTPSLMTPTLLRFLNDRLVREILQERMCSEDSLTLSPKRPWNLEHGTQNSENF
jgi:hypothetical protein